MSDEFEKRLVYQKNVPDFARPGPSLPVRFVLFGDMKGSKDLEYYAINRLLDFRKMFGGLDQAQMRHMVNNGESTILLKSYRNPMTGLIEEMVTISTIPKIGGGFEQRMVREFQEITRTEIAPVVLFAYDLFTDPPDTFSGIFWSDAFSCIPVHITLFDEPKAHTDALLKIETFNHPIFNEVSEPELIEKWWNGELYNPAFYTFTERISYTPGAPPYEFFTKVDSNQIRRTGDDSILKQVQESTRAYTTPSEPFVDYIDYSGHLFWLLSSVATNSISDEKYSDYEHYAVAYVDRDVTGLDSNIVGWIYTIGESKIYIYMDDVDYEVFTVPPGDADAYVFDCPTLKLYNDKGTIMCCYCIVISPLDAEDTTILYGAINSQTGEHVKREFNDSDLIRTSYPTVHDIDGVYASKGLCGYYSCRLLTAQKETTTTETLYDFERPE